MGISVLAEPAFLLRRRLTAQSLARSLARALARSRLGRLGVFTLLASALAIAGALPALAADFPIVGDLSISEIAPLRFGSMVLQSSGRRTVTPYGDAVDEGVIAVSGSRSAAAEYVVRYDRGNNGRQPLDVEFLVMLPGVLRVETGTLSAVLQSLTTDIRALQNGGQLILRISGCMTRICSASFRLGGTLAITRHSGGGTIVVPVPVTATVLSLSRTDD